MCRIASSTGTTMSNLTIRGIPRDLSLPICGRVTRDLSSCGRAEEMLVLDTPPDPLSSLRGYRGIITTMSDTAIPREGAGVEVSLIHSVASTEHLAEGYLVAMLPRGGIRTLYRPESDHNVIFVTERCNSNCLMCSQPPRDVDDEWRVELNLEAIRMMSPAPSRLTITGGEPTLLEEGLCRILSGLRTHLPDTEVHMLTNGRRFAAEAYTSRVAAVSPKRLTMGVPLYGEMASTHDYVVQTRHAFEQTVRGIHQLGRFGLAVEIRVVVHAATVGHLLGIAEYIYRNIPFATHVALMGLEPVGFAVANWDELWIEPSDYMSELEAAVEYLWIRGMSVSIYNLPLCWLRPSLWRFARQSISDWKNIQPDECYPCAAKNACAGFFESATGRQGIHVTPIAVYEQPPQV